MANFYREQYRFAGDADCLIHFGISGQKWGIRRYQNYDGTLTEEGRQRYLLGSDSEGNPTISKTALDLYNRTSDRMNKDLKRINKKYDKVDLNDDRNNLEYTKEIRDSWQKAYRDVLAKDLKTDPATLEGQDWLSSVFGYNSNLDIEIEELEKKVKASEKKEKKESKGNPGTSASSGSSSKSSSANEGKYANKKMSETQAIQQAYKDLEKMYPDFDKFPLDKQDQLFFDYMNESGLYKWTI